MNVSRAVLQNIFGCEKPLIGNVHLPPLPGTPRYDGSSVADLTRIALADVRAYEDGGMDGLILENHGDLPFLKPDSIGPEVIASMTAIVQAISARTGLPFGINLLANHAIGALAIAHATAARFVRVNQWVNGYVANEGFVEGRSGEALRFRRAIGADDVAIFADVHVNTDLTQSHPTGAFRNWPATLSSSMLTSPSQRVTAPAMPSLRTKSLQSGKEPPWR